MLGWRWLGWVVLFGCGADEVPQGDGSSGASEDSAGTGSTMSTGSTSATNDDTSSSSSSSSSESSGATTDPEPSTPLRAVLVDLEGEAEIAYLVETDGIEVSAPVTVHGPAPVGASLDVHALSGDLLAVETRTADDAQSWMLIEIDGASGPLVVDPAPAGHVEAIAFLHEDGRAIFSAADDVGAPLSLWSTTYAGSVAQPPERLSPPDGAATYDDFVLSDAGDAVLARRVPVGGGAQDLVWLPHAPADPDAAIVVADHLEPWQAIGAYALDPEGVAIRYTATIVDEDRRELFVDDLDPDTPPVPVHPDLPDGETLQRIAFAPDGSAVAYWAGIDNFPMPSNGDVFVAALDGASVGTLSDASDGDDFATTAALEWSSDSRWVIYIRDEAEGLRQWIVRIDAGVVMDSAALEDSDVGRGAFDPSGQYYYYPGGSPSELLRVDVSGDTPGAPEVVTDAPSDGAITFTEDAAWLGTIGSDPMAQGSAVYVLQPGMPLPTPAVRVDPPPEPGARGGAWYAFSSDQRWVITDEFIDFGVPALVHATSLADTDTRIALGRALAWTTVPDAER